MSRLGAVHFYSLCEDFLVKQGNSWLVGLPDISVPVLHLSGFRLAVVCVLVLNGAPQAVQSALVAIGPSGKIWPRLARRCRLALKRELPQTCCSECGAAGYNATVANGRCNKIIGEERCHGINQRATNIADWEECASCRATGFERNKICSLCRGVGFLFIGKI